MKREESDEPKFIAQEKDFSVDEAEEELELEAMAEVEPIAGRAIGYYATWWICNSKCWHLEIAGINSILWIQK
jgi:hypothetical protein